MDISMWLTGVAPVSDHRGRPRLPGRQARDITAKQFHVGPSQLGPSVAPMRQIGRAAAVQDHIQKQLIILAEQILEMIKRSTGATDSAKFTAIARLEEYEPFIGTHYQSPNCWITQGKQSDLR